MSEVDEDRVFTSVVSLAELGHGVELMPSGTAGGDSMSGFRRNSRNVIAEAQGYEHRPDPILEVEAMVSNGDMVSYPSADRG